MQHKGAPLTRHCTDWLLALIKQQVRVVGTRCHTQLPCGMLADPYAASHGCHLHLQDDRARYNGRTCCTPPHCADNLDLHCCWHGYGAGGKPLLQLPAQHSAAWGCHQAMRLASWGDVVSSLCPALTACEHSHLFLRSSRFPSPTCGQHRHMHETL